MNYEFEFAQSHARIGFDYHIKKAVNAIRIGAATFAIDCSIELCENIRYYRHRITYHIYQAEILTQ